MESDGYAAEGTVKTEKLVEDSVLTAAWTPQIQHHDQPVQIFQFE